MEPDEILWAEGKGISEGNGRGDSGKEKVKKVEGLTFTQLMENMRKEGKDKETRAEKFVTNSAPGSSTSQQEPDYNCTWRKAKLSPEEAEVFTAFAHLIFRILGILGIPVTSKKASINRLYLLV
jgi:hypothetical protein